MKIHRVVSEIQWISFLLRKTLFDFIKSCGGQITFSLSRIYLSRIVEKVPKNLSSYAPDQDEGNKQQCN